MSGFCVSFYSIVKYMVNNVEGEGGVLIEYGWRQKELCVFGDHNYFLFFFFFPLYSPKVLHKLSWNASCLSSHPPKVDQGFTLIDIYGLKVMYLKFHNTELNTGCKARYLRPIRNVRFCFLLILQLLYLLSLLYILMTLICLLFLDHVNCLYWH